MTPRRPRSATICPQGSAWTRARASSIWLAAVLSREDCELAVYSTEPRVLVFSTALLGSKTTRATQGVAVLTLKKKFTLDYACPAEATGIANLARYRARSLPAVGALLKAEDSDEKQISLMD